MDKARLLKEYEKNIAWLRRNVPPDDIYDFAEQTYMAALYFLKRMSMLVDMRKELDTYPPSKKYATNLCLVLHLREQGIDSPLDFNLDVYDDD